MTGTALPDHLELSDDLVTLRPWTLDDVPILTAIWQDAELQRRFAVEPPVTDASTATFVHGMTLRWRHGDQLSFAVVEEGRVVGGCDLDELRSESPQLGYWIAVPDRRRGLASRAGALLLDWAGKALVQQRIELEVERDNVGSIGVAKRLGFARVEGEERRDGDRVLAVYARPLRG